MNKVFITLLLACLFAGQAYGAQERKEEAEIIAGNTYKGQVISAETLVKLAPRAPKQVEKQVQTWLQKNPKFVEAALDYEPMVNLGYDKKTLQNTRVRHRGIIKRLNQITGQKNMSTYNYVYDVPGTGYVLKIGGLLNRLQNVVMMSGKSYGVSLNQDDYARLSHLPDANFDKTVGQQGQLEVIKNAPKTFQTSSRIATYLLFKDAKNKGSIAQNMQIVPMYLVHIPGRPTELSDRNYVAIEPKVQGLSKIDFSNLSNQEKKQIAKVIRTIGLFDVNSDNLQKTQDGSIIFLDTEQPNTEAPGNFFHKAEYRIRSNTKNGLELFAKLLEEAQKKQAEAQQQADPAKAAQ